MLEKPEAMLALTFEFEDRRVQGLASKRHHAGLFTGQLLCAVLRHPKAHKLQETAGAIVDPWSLKSPKNGKNSLQPGAVFQGPLSVYGTSKVLSAVDRNTPTLQ